MTPQEFMEKYHVRMSAEEGKESKKEGFECISFQVELYSYTVKFFEVDYTKGFSHIGIWLEKILDKGPATWEKAEKEAISIAKGMVKPPYKWGFSRKKMPLQDKPLWKKLVKLYKEAKPVSTEEVLESISCDISTADMPFEFWCLELGYNPDSIKARKIYDQVQEEALAIRFHLGIEGYKDLLELERD